MRLFLLGMGYSGGHIAALARVHGFRVVGTTRDGRGDSIAFADADRTRFEIGQATHILSSVPPGEAGDPVLDAHGAAIAARAGDGAWVGYLSSTGVYGDTGGAWADESAPTGMGRRSARAAADAAWRALPGARVFRLPGIYGPGRSALDRVRAGTVVRVDAGAQLFSRVHVADLAHGVLAGFAGPAGVFNLADDVPAAQSAVLAYACRLLGVAVPPLVPLEQAALGAAARGFYAESRQIANGRARRVLGWRPRYPDYRAGLRALSATTSPANASTPPAIASGDQR